MRRSATTPTVRRSRAGTTKSRTGCKTCRLRHVRCDETKPACANCCHGGWLCEGYPTSPNHGAGPRLRSIKPRTTAGAASQPSNSLLVSEEESRYLLLFRNVTADVRAGFFRASFWTRTLLQESHSSPAVTHALVAIGALYKTLEGSSDFSFGRTNTRPTATTAAHHAFALQQYSKAITLTRKALQNGETTSLRTALISCVLFSCFEAFHGNQNTAVAQVHSGIRLLEARQFNMASLKDRCHDSVESDIIQLFRETVNSFNTYNTSFHRNVTLPIAVFATDDPVTAPTASEIPFAFSTVDQASVAWHRIKTCAFQFFFSKKQLIGGSYCESAEPGSEYGRITDLIKRCTRALQPLLCCGPNKIPEILSGQAINLDARITQILFQFAFEDGGNSRNMYNAECIELLDIIESVLYNLEGILSSLSRQAHFSFDVTLIYPLFFVATRCRVAQTRRRAIALLSSAARREGLWDSALAAKIATFIMDMEEVGWDDQDEIQDAARVTLKEVSFDDMGRTATVSFLSNAGVVTTVPFTL